MLTSSTSRIVLRTANGIGGKTALKGLIARSVSVPSSSSYSLLTSKTKVRLLFEKIRVNPCCANCVMILIRQAYVTKTNHRHVSIPRTKSQSYRPSNAIDLNQQVAFKSALPIEEDPIRSDYNSSATYVGTDACVKSGISKLGITGPTTIYKNQTYEELYQHEVRNSEGKVAHAEYGTTFTVDTGKFTGRSPKDKWIVRNVGSQSDTNIDWGTINQPTTPEVFEDLYQKAVDYFNTKEKAYVFDGFCGANPKSQRKIRFVHEQAWQQHFVTNMFIRANDGSGKHVCMESKL